MAYGSVAETGLTGECYRFCPDTDFSMLVGAVEGARADVTLAHEVGISPGGVEVLTARLEETRAPFCKAAEACKTDGPWRATEGKLLCGRIAIDITVAIGKTDTEITRYERPDPQE